LIVAVVSDTHDNMQSIRSLLAVLREYRPQMIIHLGDIISPFALRELLTYPAKFVIILGNNDGDKLLLKDIALKAGASMREGPAEIHIDNRRILALHGYGSIETTRNLVNALAMLGSYDAILYGHTHECDVRNVGSTLILNPGECCGYLSGKKTFALLNTETMTAKIIELQ